MTGLWPEPQEQEQGRGPCPHPPCRGRGPTGDPIQTPDPSTVPSGGRNHGAPDLSVVLALLDLLTVRTPSACPPWPRRTPHHLRVSGWCPVTSLFPCDLMLPGVCFSIFGLSPLLQNLVPVQRPPPSQRLSQGSVPKTDSPSVRSMDFHGEPGALPSTRPALHPAC